VTGQCLSCRALCHPVVSRNPSHRLPCVPSDPPDHSLLSQMGFPPRRPQLLSVAHAPDPGVNQSSATHAEHRPSGRLMRIPESSLSPEITRCADVPPMPPRWLPAFRPVWRVLAGWPAQTPVGHGPTESNGRQPQPQTGARGMSAAADPGGGATLDGGTSVAPPPVLTPPAPTDSGGEHSERPVDAGQCARLRALSTTLPTPDREIILLWAVAGVSLPDIAATLGVTPAAVRLAQSQALSALPPAATTNGPPPATRQRVVLLPHVRNRPTTAVQKAAR
jgi:hypothetical protein